MKLTVTVEFDDEAYTKKHGPGSEFYAKYYTDRPDEYKPMTAERYEAILRDVLEEGFYDWSSEGWLKLKIER